MMADESKQDESKSANEGARTYKWMTSVLVPSRMRGFYLKPLELITPSASVPFQRVIVSIFVAAILLIFGVQYLTNLGSEGDFVRAPVIVIMAAVVVMAIVYMLSSRNKSMLKTVFDYNVFKIYERRRCRRNPRLVTLGIESINDDGRVFFENGDVGAVYDVRGQISESTLPRVARQIDDVRAGWYVARNATCQEMRVTSIEPNDMVEQFADLARIVRSRSRSQDPRDVWITQMAQEQRLALKHLENSGTQLTMNQTVILRDADFDKLSYTERRFREAANTGMYERVARMEDPDAILERLSGVTLSSRWSRGGGRDARR